MRNLTLFCFTLKLFHREYKGHFLSRKEKIYEFPFSIKVGKVTKVYSLVNVIFCH